MKLYAGVLGVLISAFIYLVFTRSAVEADLLRAPGALYQTAPDGGIENLYLLHLVNKTSHDLPVVLKLEKPSGELKLLGAEHMVVPKDQLATTSVLIDLPKSSLTGHNTKIRIGVFSGDKRLETIDTVFIGPRDETQAPVR